MPLSVKSRFKKRPAGVPFTLICGTLTNCGWLKAFSASHRNCNPGVEDRPGTLVRQGKASEVIQTYVARPGSNAVNAALACAYSRANRRDEAEKAADLSGFYRTVAFAYLGDKDRVFEVFDSNAALGPIRIGWFLLRADREDPGLLRGDPRLKALRKKVGLPE